MLKISLSFCAGTALGLLLGASGPLAAATLAGAVGAMILIGRCGRFDTPAILLTFLLAGMFSQCSAGLSGSIGARNPEGFYETVLGAMISAVDRTPFRESGTGALLKALLCGDRSFLGRETIEAFRRSGASHILALSGLHLGIIYLVVRTLLGVLGNSPAGAAARSALCVAFCGSYALVTGASPSIVRAFLFILLREISRMFPGRSRSGESIYCTALTVHLALNPGAIASAGFQLSYLAMAGIYTIFPRLRDWYPQDGRAGVMRRIWEMAALSISCQLFTAPAAWLHFHTFPKYFLLTNLLALPLTEALIVCGIAGIITNLAFKGGFPASQAVRLTDFLARLLTDALGVISQM